MLERSVLEVFQAIQNLYGLLIREYSFLAVFVRRKRRRDSRLIQVVLHGVNSLIEANKCPYRIHLSPQTRIR